MSILHTEQNADIAPIVHLVRHGHIPNHRADHPLTPEGRQGALTTGRKLAGGIRPGETIRVFASPVRRARQTAELLRDGLSEALSALTLAARVMSEVIVDDRLQNLQFYLDGLSYDPIQPLFDAARWRLQQTSAPRDRACVAFHAEFWRSPDPMDYWLTHAGEAVEAPAAVASRTYAYIAERLTYGTEREGLYRDICVSHSANLRAFLRRVFGSDPGEPDFCEMVTISNRRVYYRGRVENFSLFESP